jgi:hypothetical protein
MKEILSKESALNCYFDLEIYQIINKFVEEISSDYSYLHIDEEIMIKVLLKRIKATSNKFYIHKSDIHKINEYSRLLDSIQDGIKYKNFLSALEASNFHRYSEICEIHLNSNHHPSLRIEKLDSNEDLLNHIIFKYFTRLKPSYIEELKSLLTELLTRYQPGDSWEETISSFSPDIQPTLHAIITNIGIENLEILQNFFSHENDDELIFRLDDIDSFSSESQEVISPVAAADSGYFVGESPISSISSSSTSNAHTNIEPPIFFGALGKHFPHDGGI